MNRSRNHGIVASKLWPLPIGNVTSRVLPRHPRPQVNRVGAPSCTSADIETRWRGRSEHVAGKLRLMCQLPHSCPYLDGGWRRKQHQNIWELCTRNMARGSVPACWSNVGSSRCSQLIQLVDELPAEQKCEETKRSHGRANTSRDVHPQTHFEQLCACTTKNFYSSYL